MTVTQALELKSFLPALDFEASRRFYRDLGFSEYPHGETLVEMLLGSVAFLLQNLYHKQWAENCVMHLLVEDADTWWQHITISNLLTQHAGCRAIAPEDKPWGLRQLSLVDPSGVLWHIGNRLT
ncbi:hypothetical protein ACUHMQ_01110 [Chitinimonas sp. PSY-7]|uniref:hypothetical protein n=1 Tax=Chitinimonas sp. PSY-7 TaxID=3459088 RepID=UPI00403FD309